MTDHVDPADARTDWSAVAEERAETKRRLLVARDAQSAFDIPALLADALAVIGCLELEVEELRNGRKP